MQILFLVFMFVIGAIFGSFLCCQVERLELKTKNKKIKNQFSICLHCHKKLKWYDNIPILSWLMLKGKCRYCHKPIGIAEFLSEILSGLSLLAIATTLNVETSTPFKWAIFIATVIFTLSLIFLAIYDGLYGALPTWALTFSIICAIIIVILRTGDSFLVAGFFDENAKQIILQSLLSGALFGGIYLILYLASKGRWVGDGDWLLALAIGLALGSPWLSMIALFASNLSACLVMLPFLKKQKNHQIYFGPFLVFAFIIVYTFSDFCLSVI